jgi:hypothetical protein
MYLDGQLPYGPATSNIGAPPVPTFDVPGTPQTYTVPEGGPVVIHSSVANADGIVQVPGDPVKTPTQGVDTDSASYNQCGDYAADGSLTSIRNRRPIDPACAVGSVPGPSAAGIGMFLLAFGGLMLLTSKGGK